MSQLSRYEQDAAAAAALAHARAHGDRPGLAAAIEDLIRPLLGWVDQLTDRDPAGSDRRSAAYLALVEAAHAYQSERGPFADYAKVRAYGAMLQAAVDAHVLPLTGRQRRTLAQVRDVLNTQQLPCAGTSTAPVATALDISRQAAARALELLDQRGPGVRHLADDDDARLLADPAGGLPRLLPDAGSPRRGQLPAPELPADADRLLAVLAPAERELLLARYSPGPDGTLPTFDALAAADPAGRSARQIGYAITTALDRLRHAADLLAPSGEGFAAARTAPTGLRRSAAA